MFLDPDDDVVSSRAWGTGKIWFGQAERFAELAFDAVAADRVTDWATDAQAQAMVGELVGAGVDDEWAAGFACASGVDGLKLSGVAETILAAVGKPRRVDFGLFWSTAHAGIRIGRARLAA